MSKAWNVKECENCGKGKIYHHMENNVLVCSNGKPYTPKRGDER